MIFRYEGREYSGSNSVDIVEQLAGDEHGFAARHGRVVPEYLRWSLDKLADRLPPREMELSERHDDEALARNYLLMCAEYQIGELISR